MLRGERAVGIGLGDQVRVARRGVLGKERGGERRSEVRKGEEACEPDEAVRWNVRGNDILCLGFVFIRDDLSCNSPEDDLFDLEQITLRLQILGHKVVHLLLGQCPLVAAVHLAKGQLGFVQLAIALRGGGGEVE